MASFIAGIFFAFLACILPLAYLFRSVRGKRDKNGSLSLPPGPRGLPILGHLHMLGDSPHRTLRTLANKYGSIMSIRLGLVPTIVVSSPEAAELFLKTHDAVFAGRPRTQIGEYYGESKNLVFAPYGAYWRNIRKLCSSELFSSSKVEMFRPTRKEEVVKFVESIKKASDSGFPRVDISAKVESLIENLTYRMIFGFNDDKFSIRSTLKEAMEIGGILNLADYIPFLGAFDIQGIGRRKKAVQHVVDDFFEKIIDEHVRDSKEVQREHRDFIDVMLSKMEPHSTGELQLGRDHIKGIMLDILGAATDTSSTTIEWAIAELIKSPRAMKLVQDELENVVGLDRMVEETDLVKLEYLKNVVKETMRLHTPTPLLIPHASVEDITLNGYFIPKKAIVLINAWAIGRDHNVWSDNAEEFYPERFIGTGIDVQGHHHQLIPFGAGRRKCPGIQLGLTAVQIVLAQILHCFNLKLPDGKSPDDLDMTEKFGISLPLANHLHVVPTYRLRV